MTILKVTQGYTPKPPPLATEPNYFLQAEKPPKNLWLSRKVILLQAVGKNDDDVLHF